MFQNSGVRPSTEFDISSSLEEITAEVQRLQVDVIKAREERKENKRNKREKMLKSFIWNGISALVYGLAKGMSERNHSVGSDHSVESDQNAGSDHAKCVACLSVPATVLYLDCRHLCLCVQCANEYPSKTCPLCRKENADRITVFTS
jgi:hypothetical protein